MPWKAPRTPNAPYNITAVTDDTKTNKITISWLPPQTLPGGDVTEYYSIYKPDSKSERMNSENLFKIVQADKTSLSLAVPRPDRINYYFAVKSLDKFWNESIKSSGIKEVKIPSLKLVARQISLETNPVLLKNEGSITLVVQSGYKEELKVENESGRHFFHSLKPGLNIFEIEASLNASTQLDLSFSQTGKKTSLKLR